MLLMCRQRSGGDWTSYKNTTLLIFFVNCVVENHVDHSSLLAVISMAQDAPNLCVIRKVSLKHQGFGIRFVVQCRICPGVTFGLLTILLRF